MTTRARPVAEVARVFLKLGVVGFGGPAAHVALMRDEVVAKRQWITEQEFVDTLGVTSALPGPGSTQMAMVIGRRRAGWGGLVVGGTCFIAPAFVLVLGLAWAYVHYGHSTVGTGLRYGLGPAVIAVVAKAVWGLSRVALKRAWAGLVAAAALGAFLAGVDVLLILAGAAFVAAVASGGPQLMRRSPTALVHPVAVAGLLAAGTGHLTRPRNSAVFLEFLKLGVVVFGSGYVLVAYLHHDLVGATGWITSGHLLDAVAVGQLTPGPVFTSATFVGYLVAGLPGALVATAGIFLPSFALAALVAPAVTRARRSVWLSAALDGVNAAAIGLMAGVGVDLARTALTGVLPVAVAAAGAAVLVRWRVNSSWVVAAGAMAGLIHALA